MPSRGGLVEGIVYEVEEKDLQILDVHEKYYQRFEVDILVSNGTSVKAITYLSQNAREEKSPTREYLNFLLEAKELLSPEYFEGLNRITVFSEDLLKQKGPSGKG
jgi:cation transport regulator ChaC